CLARMPKNPSTSLSQEAGRGVVEVDLRIVRQPGFDLLGCVRRRVVQDHVKLTAGIPTDDVLHEDKEVGRCVRVAHAMRDLASCDLKSGEEVDDSVTLVVVRVPNGAPGAQWQRWLRPLQGLDRGLLV